MKINKWTIGLAAVGLVSIPASGLAEEKMNPMLTALTPTSISGYVNTSIHWDPGTGNAHVPAYGLNGGKQDGFNLDVVNLTISKPLDESQWSAGYTVELLFGPDANAYATGSSKNTAVSGFADDGAGGTITNRTALANNSDFGIKQAYVALRAPVGNGLDFKIGVWDTLFGYEVFNAGNNPNYTRSYGWTIEPTTHTGVSATYQICKYASASVAIANTYGPAINARANPPKAESYKSYMGMIMLTAPEDWGFLGGSTLYGTFMNGFNAGTQGGSDQTQYFIGATLNTPLKWLKVGACYDYLGTSAEDFGGTGANHYYANATTLYASMTATEKLSFHLRGEYASTDTTLLGDAANLPHGGSKILAATATVQYDLWKNVLTRAEVRWDHLAGDGSQTGYGGDLAKGETSGSKRNYYTLALNVIYKF